MTIDDDLRRWHDQQEARHHLRHLRDFEPQTAPWISANGHLLLDLTTNDFLGLARHPEVLSGAQDWLQRYGAGARASRVLGGTWPALLALEARLAQLKDCEAALMFPSGFQANATAIPALLALNKKMEVFCDRLAHASIYAGCAAAGVRVQRFLHNDMNHLADLLERRADALAPALVITESVFSMDGDLCPLADLADLAARYPLLVYVDEAHATGVLGEGGRGLAHAALLPRERTLILGTLGKALGASGAFIAGPRRWVDYLVNRAAGFIYSTALPPASCGAVYASLNLLPTLEGARAHLAALGEVLRKILTAHGFDTMNSRTHIVPAIVGDAARALYAQEQLMAQGFLVMAVRPPTVPPHSSRLRFSLNSAVQMSDLQRLDQTLASLT